MASDRSVNVIILGAAGRDFHDFNVYYRDDPRYRVVAFTANQIPDIDGRAYPRELAGERYPDGIPIYPESSLTQLIREHEVGECSMSYSDLAHAEVMHKAALVNAAGADFRILGSNSTMLTSTRPVIAVCAVRTGCGKSQTSRAINTILRGLDKRVATVRHPMPYGDLRKQICQRFGALEDMTRHECTIEEREEYEHHIAQGNVVFAGVDYEKILRAAEAEADVVLWDGGNNDTSFYRPDLLIVVADPHRAGHEVGYFPGETNTRMADVVLINKIETATAEGVRTVEENVRRVNPRAKILRASSPVAVERPEEIRGKRVLLVEDGPTLTHGEMKIGAAHVAATQNGAAEIVDPRPHAAGSIRGVFEKYPHLTDVLPAMGYGQDQMNDLQATINAVDCDLVLIGTPIDLGKLMQIDKPAMRVTYGLDEQAVEALRPLIENVVAPS